MAHFSPPRIKCPLISPSDALVQQQQCYLSYRKPEFHSRTKDIEIDVHYICDKVSNGQLEIRYVLSSDHVADILTKPLSIDKFNFPRCKLQVLSKTYRMRGNVKDFEDPPRYKSYLSNSEINWEDFPAQQSQWSQQFVKERQPALPCNCRRF